MNPTGSTRAAQSPIPFAEDGTLTAAVRQAVAAAREAQRAWRTVPVTARLECVRQLRQLIAKQGADLAAASAKARQRPAREALVAEVLPLAEACRFLEREAARLLAPRRLGRRGLPLWLTGVSTEIQRDPLGVVFIIGPGNYPLLLTGVQLIQALVAGNAVILKPGVGGMAAAQTLLSLVVTAGFDPRLVVLLPETTSSVHAALAAQPDKVIFTGSAATGEKILAQLAPRLIPATMELSGCDAVIVRADADLALTVRALVFGLTLNAGATCLAPKRVFVHRAVATELEGLLARAFARSHRGDEALTSLPPETPSTPRSAQPGQAEGHIQALVQDALDKGAHFIVGELKNQGPIILGGVSPSSRLLREDAFAPVLALITVADDDEALTRANDCPYALGASIFSRDEAAARALASQLRVGVVSLNDLIVPTGDARVPFGGRARSGFGVTRGAEGLLELTTPKVVTVSRARMRPAFDAPMPGDEDLFLSYLQLTHGSGFKNRGRALFQLLQSLIRRGRPVAKKP